MIISSSAIQLSSQRTSVEMYEKQESLAVWNRSEEPRVSGAGRGHRREINPSAENSNRIEDRVSLGRHGRHFRHRQVSRAEMDVSEEDQQNIDLNMKVLVSMFERITGRKFQMVQPVADASASQVTAETAANDNTNTDAAQPVDGAEQAPADNGLAMAYDYHEARYEAERTDFQGQGVIKTGDGSEINFNVSLSMSREYYSEQNFSMSTGAVMKDPLVINFSGNAAEVTQRDFQFDIDADGQADQIGFVGPGSGFLALDQNGDGAINDGSELFGAVSGNGFADLAAYDSDGNSWIDENDDIYNSLRIWSRNANGEDQLMGLGQAGVGAIYLQHIETLFSVNDSENNMLGQIKETGLAVMESGQVVTMQQLDLVA